MARNYTTVIEHEKITILPGIGLEIRGRGVMALLLSIYIPLTVLVIFLFRSNITVLLFVIFLEIVTLFFVIDYLQKDVRQKTDHISSGKKLYYEYRAYRKIHVDGETHYIRPMKRFYELDIRKV